MLIALSYLGTVFVKDKNPSSVPAGMQVVIVKLKANGDFSTI
jgi:hypothetical protein